jgi:hypothetical protein
MANFQTNITRFTSLRTISPPVPLAALQMLCEGFPNPEYEYNLDSSHEFTNINTMKSATIELYAKI